MKNKPLVFVLLFVALPFSCVLAQTSTQRDGNWWRDKDDIAKLDYVIGIFDGMELGHDFTFWDIEGAKEKGSSCLDQALSSYSKFSGKFFANVTSSQIADGLDVFYKDYRNRSIRVYDAIWVVANNIAGTPQEKIDKLTENLRKNAASQQ
jgi:hypothetical protein